MPAIINKQQVLAHLSSALKKKFTPPPPAEKRPIMEELVFALCREGVTPEAAHVAFTRLKEDFFDWNEVRVSTVQEVADALAGLPDAGTRAKKVIEFLQELFEMTYSFSLEDLEKKGLKQAAKQLARYQAVSGNDFAVAWVVQRSLGGHAVPLDGPALRALRRLGIVEEETDDLEAIRATLEHYIPKAKGVEFTDGLAEFAATICLEKTPQCKTCPMKDECPAAAVFLAPPKKEKTAEKEIRPKKSR
jgi:endonuclease III